MCRNPDKDLLGNGCRVLTLNVWVGAIVEMHISIAAIFRAQLKNLRNLGFFSPSILISQNGAALPKF